MALKAWSPLGASSRLSHQADLFAHILQPYISIVSWTSLCVLFMLLPLHTMPGSIHLYIYFTNKLSPLLPLWSFSWFLPAYTQTHKHTHRHSCHLVTGSSLFHCALLSFYGFNDFPILSEYTKYELLVLIIYFLVHVCFSQITCISVGVCLFFLKCLVHAVGFPNMTDNSITYYSIYLFS